MIVGRTAGSHRPAGPVGATARRSPCCTGINADVADGAPGPHRAPVPECRSRAARGDHNDLDSVVRLADHGPYDLVVDNLAFTPRATLRVAHALKAVTRMYVMVSSVSGYQGWPVELLTEDAPTLDCTADAGPGARLRCRSWPDYV